MYSSLELELRCGDIFVEVPIPVLDHEGGFHVDPGPAMLVDHDCQICKQNLKKFTFAPLRSLADQWPDPGMQGTIRKGDVRHLLYLPPHAELEDLEWVVDLAEMFSLPRAAFDLESTFEGGDPREHRWYVAEESGYNERAISLDDDGRTALTMKLIDIFRLDELVIGDDDAADG